MDPLVAPVPELPVWGMIVYLLLRDAIAGLRLARQRQNGVDETSRGKHLLAESDAVRDMHRVVLAVDAQGRPLVYGQNIAGVQHDVNQVEEDLREHFREDARHAAALLEELRGLRSELHGLRDEVRGRLSS